MNTKTKLAWGSCRGDRSGVFSGNTKEDKGFVDVDFFWHHYASKEGKMAPL